MTEYTPHTREPEPTRSDIEAVSKEVDRLESVIENDRDRHSRETVHKAEEKLPHVQETLVRLVEEAEELKRN